MRSPDVDLYVTDPTGNTSYWNNPVTPDGGALDIGRYYRIRAGALDADHG
jgi:uncharacterized protein YfaP (DUF2135 family)